MNISIDSILNKYNVLVNQICQHFDYNKYMVKYKQIEIENLKEELLLITSVKQNELVQLKEQIEQTTIRLTTKQLEYDNVQQEILTIKSDTVSKETILQMIHTLIAKHREIDTCKEQQLQLTNKLSASQHETDMIQKEKNSIIIAKQTEIDMLKKENNTVLFTKQHDLDYLKDTFTSMLTAKQVELDQLKEQFIQQSNVLLVKQNANTTKEEIVSFVTQHEIDIVKDLPILVNLPQPEIKPKYNKFKIKFF